jgi:hypothetical protein
MALAHARQVKSAQLHSDLTALFGYQATMKTCVLREGSRKQQRTRAEAVDRV